MHKLENHLLRLLIHHLLGCQFRFLVHFICIIHLILFLVDHLTFINYCFFIPLYMSVKSHHFNYIIILFFFPLINCQYCYHLHPHILVWVFLLFLFFQQVEILYQIHQYFSPFYQVKILHIQNSITPYLNQVHQMLI